VTLEARGRAGVASGHPAAAAAGVAALAAGGTAVDAVLAAAFTQWVVNAPLCGPGGDLVVLAAGDGGVVSYGGWSRVPGALDERAQLTARGPRAAVVPGALRGAEAAWRAAGRLPWRDLFDGALDAAGGHPVTAWMARIYADVERRGNGHAIGSVADRRVAPAEGDVMTFSRLGRTLGLVAAGGVAPFYEGEVAAQVVAAARRDAGWIMADDLRDIGPCVEEADRVELDDVTLWLTPFPSQAAITARLLEAVDRADDPGSTRFVEATAPLTEELLVKRCTVGLAGTAVSVSADADGRSAAVVHSLAGTQFGSAWVAGETGVAFGNRVGTALSTRVELPAANPRPGELLPHTLSAAHVEREDTWLTVATPGGDRQVQWLAQAIQRFRRGAAAAEIASAPRWFVCPEGDRFGVPAGIGKPWYLFGEPGVEWSGAARCAGYDVRHVDSVGGGLQLVHGGGRSKDFASDPRSGGGAAVEEARCT
jgi:gamma-glutamyltranspeptidase/glutathione hydrolase